MKKLIVLLLALCTAFSTLGLTGCKKSDGTLIVWAHTQELKDIVEDYYLEAFPEKKGKVRVEVYPDDVFQTKLDGVLGTGINVPDVMILQIGYIQKYIESGRLASLSSDGLDLATKAQEVCYDYTIDVASGADGKLYGLAWQAIPGGYFYRRSAARALWGEGNDTPEYVQSKMSDWDAFMEVAYDWKALDAGHRILSSLNGSLDVFTSQRSTPWIVDNTLTLQPFVDQYFDHVYKLQKGVSGDKAPLGLFVNETSQFTQGWYSDMSNPDIFGFFLPAWGMRMYLKQYAGDTAGDWGLVRGPVSWYSGSSMLSVYEGSKNKDAAKHLLDYLCLNEAFLEEWGSSTGEFVNNVNVVAKIKETCSEPFLGGQNHYAMFEEWVRDVDGSTVGPYDSAISVLLRDVSIQHALQTQGYKTVEEAKNQFRALLRNSFPKITVV